MELIKINNEVGEIPLIEGMQILRDRPHPAHYGSGDSRQVRVKFANGRGASIIRSNGSYGYEYGKWELAVLDKTGKLDYSTEITDDVIGHLSEEEVLDTLKRISNLN